MSVIGKCFMMKLFLLLILCFLIHGEESEERRTPDDLPDLTAPESIISREELDQLNKLRKDILKSLKDLESKVTDPDKHVIRNNMFRRSFNYLYTYYQHITDKYGLQDHVAAVEGVLNEALENFGDRPEMLKKFTEETSKEKYTDYVEKVLPELRNRLEPFLKYGREEEEY